MCDSCIFNIPVKGKLVNRGLKRSNDCSDSKLLEMDNVRRSPRFPYVLFPW